MEYKLFEARKSEVGIKILKAGALPSGEIICDGHQRAPVILTAEGCT